MPTTARGIWTPSDTDAVDFTTDLATMAGTIDNALDLYGNALRGTASQRAAFLSTAVDGMLWQDTDGIRMIWRKDGALWVPAVWRWRGTTAQMNSFGANAPDGFEWFSTTDNSDYVRLAGAWTSSVGDTGYVTLTPLNGATVQIPMAYRVLNGVAYIFGRVTSSGASGTVASLPVGVRPNADLRMAGMVGTSGSGVSVVQVTAASGDIVMPLTTQVNLALTFPVA